MKKSNFRKHRLFSRGRMFYSIYVSFIILMLMAIAVVLTVLLIYLKGYEGALPQYKAQEVFNDLFEPPDYDKLYELCGSSLSGLEEKDNFKKCLDSVIGDSKLTYRAVSSGLSEEKKYTVLAGEKEISSFSLKNTESGDKWELQGVDMTFSPGRSYKIRVLSGVTVTVNGKKLDETYVSKSSNIKTVGGGQSFSGFIIYDTRNLTFNPEIEAEDTNGNPVTLSYDENSSTYTENTLQNTGSISVKVIKGSILSLDGFKPDESFIKEDNIKSDSCAYMPEGVDGIKYSLYNLLWVGSQPNIVITNKYGHKADIVQDEKTGIYTEQIESDADGAAKWADYAVNAVQTYAKFMTRNASESALKSYFDTSSEIYKYIIKSDTWCNTGTHDCIFTGTTTKNFYMYDKNTFSVSVSFTQKIVKDSQTMLFPFNQTVYFCNLNGNYVIYQMVAN